MDKLGILYAIAAAVVWGIVYTVDQKVLVTLNPITLVFVQGIVSSLLLLPFILYSHSKGNSLPSKKDIILILVTVVLTALANFLIFSSIKRIGATHSSIIEISYPFFVTLFTFLFFVEKISISFIVGAILIFIGSAIVIYGG